MQKKCLWCLKEEAKTTFNKKAHTIPKSLGEKQASSPDQVYDNTCSNLNNCTRVLNIRIVNSKELILSRILGK